MLNLVSWGAEQHLKEMRMALEEADDGQKPLDMSLCEYLPGHMPPNAQGETEAVL